MRLVLLFAAFALLLGSGPAAADLPKYARFVPLAALAEHDQSTTTLPPAVAPTRGPVRSTLDDPIGPVDTVGTTWWDEQQYTTCGKQVAVDADGYVHHVWTRGTTSGSAQRHIFYNVWSPADGDVILPEPTNPIGTQVDQAQRAGYVTLAVNSAGFAFPAYHEVTGTSSVPHAAVALDFAPRMGGFSTFQIPYLDDRRIIYPKIACDPAGDLQVISSEGTTNFTFYSRGRPYISGGFGDSIRWMQGFTDMDSTFFLSHDIAASYQSSRLAFAYTEYDMRDELGINVFVRVSEDGGLNWVPPVNITNFPEIDTNCVNNGGSIPVCNQDTMRPYVDVSVILDQNDVAHVAFSTRGFYYWDETGEVGPWLHNDGVGSIWHWDEVRQEFNIIADRPYGTLTHGLGKVQAMVHRPNLAVDTTTGFLYCSYQAYDTNQWSAGGYLQADAWVSVSADGGRLWSAGTNVTSTPGGQDTPEGQCFSERDISLATYVTGDTIHMQYQLDLDAGTAINAEPEGLPTNNPILYMRIPTALIPTRPYINPYRVLRLDSTGYPFGLDTTLAVGERPALQPGEFALYQNYPNPFNPATHIQFDLASQSLVSLKVFDVMGREVAALLNEARLGAGVHVYNFEAGALPSGVYFYRLETPQSRQTMKMVLMK